jgi:outer membrane protein insertion porin family
MCSSVIRLLALVVIASGIAARLDAAPPDVVGRTITEIRLDNDLPIDRRGLTEWLPLRVGEPLTEDNLAEAERRLRAKQIFRSVDIQVLAEGDGVIVVLHLERTRVVGAVRASGYEALRREDMRRLIRLEPGAPFEPSVIDAARGRILKRYADLGFPEAEVTVDETLQSEAVDLDFYIREGRALIINSIVVEGSDVLTAKQVEEAIRDARGERWTREQRRALQSALLKALRANTYYAARAWCRFADERAIVEGVAVCRIEAGPRHVIEIVGNHAKDDDDLLSLDALNERLLITDGTWRELGREMVRTYQAAGYYRATVKTEVEGEDPKHVRFVIEEGRWYRLRAIRFTGNAGLSDEELRSQLATREKPWWPWSGRGALQDELVDDDLSRLWFYYREQGFEHAEIVDARREVDGEQGTIDLEIVIDEGPRTIVQKVEYENLPALRATPALQVQAGTALGPERLKQDRHTIALALSREGYADASVEPQVERAPGASGEQATVEWQVTPGPRRRIGRIIVQNNLDTRDLVVTRELPFESGDPLDTTALLEAQSKVYQVGLFRSVQVRPLDPEPGAPADVRDVGIYVVERPPGRIEWGTGYNTRDGILGSVEVGYDNLRGMNRRIGTRLRVAVDPTDLSDSQYLASITYREPRLFGSEIKFQNDVIGERATKSIDPYSVERASWILGADRKLTPAWRVGTDLRTEYSYVFDVEPDAELTDVDEGSLHAVTPGVFVFYDRRDSAFVPRSGTFDTARLGYALPLLSTVQSVKLTAGHSHYVPLPSSLTFLYALRAGWGRALSGSSQLPISERFFLGGRSTVRGFGENDVGPEGQNGAPIGGDVSLNVNLELQFPLVYGFEGAIFADGGAVYLQNSDDRNSSGEPLCANFCSFSFDNFRRSAGLGLRYITPIGPLSLDYGFKLDRRSGESIGAVHFSVGVMF